jgi:small subunit ribosomal protein S1
VNAEKGEVALGVKQTGPNPWEGIETKYPAGSRVQGKVVNLTDYGAFIKLEDGVEGLLHISELSWTVKVKHPSEILAMGDAVEVQVIALEPEKQKVSFSMKALEPNPWETITEKYPVGTVAKGKVYNLTHYGAFVELEKGIEGLLHVKDLDWKKIKHPSEVLKKGDKVEVVVLEVDQEKKRIALGRKQLLPQPPPESAPSEESLEPAGGGSSGPETDEDEKEKKEEKEEKKEKKEKKKK